MAKKKSETLKGYETYSGKSWAEQLLADTWLGNLLYGPEKTYTDGYGHERKDASFSESANGQEAKRMTETAKDAAKISAIGLAFGNPLTAGEVMSPLITGAQAYMVTEGLKDAKQRVNENLTTKKSKWEQAGDVAMIGLDLLGAYPALKSINTGWQQAAPELEKGWDVMRNYVKNAAADIASGYTKDLKSTRYATKLGRFGKTTTSSLYVLGNANNHVLVQGEAGWNSPKYDFDTYFGEFLGSGGEQTAFRSWWNKDLVIKPQTGVSMISDPVLEFPFEGMLHNVSKFQIKRKPFGVIRMPDGKYMRVLQQEYYQPLTEKQFLELGGRDKLGKQLITEGFVQDKIGSTHFTKNGNWIDIIDAKPENLSVNKNGDILMIDVWSNK